MQSPIVRRRQGFTLIELLVVIAIIAVLMSILLPSYARARYQAKVLLCGNQVRNLTVVYNMYAMDFNEWLPVTPDTNLEWEYSELHDVTAEGFIDIRTRLYDETERMFCPFWFDIYEEDRFKGTEKELSKIQRILQKKYWYRNDKVYVMGYALMTHWRLDPELNPGAYFFDDRPLRVTRTTDPPDRVFLADYSYFRGAQSPPQWEDGVRHLPPYGRRYQDMHGFRMEVPEGSWSAKLDGSAEYSQWQAMEFRYGSAKDAEYWW